MKWAAASLALPSLSIFEETRARAAPSNPLRNLLIYHFPNGRVPEWWVPQEGAAGLVFPTETTALQPFAGRTLALAGLSNDAALASPGAAHAMGTGTLLTSTRIASLQGGIFNNISVDQAVAEHIGVDTAFSSLAWSAGEPGPCDVGNSPCAYTQSVSWAGPGSPVAPVINPRVAFEQLFSGGQDGLKGQAALKRKASVGSILDFLVEDGKSLGNELGSEDRARLEEYFTAVRSLENRVRSESGECAGEIPAEGLDYPDRVEAFHDLMTLALSCGLSRVISFMIEFDLSGRSHPFIDAPGGHHSLSHDSSPEGRAQLRRLETWHADKLASLLTRLEATKGIGAPTLLDETLVLAIPSMGYGNAHDHGDNCPLLIGGGSALQTNGRKQTYAAEPMANLHVTLLEAFSVTKSYGADGARFGDNGDSVLSGVIA